MAGTREGTQRAGMLGILLKQAVASRPVTDERHTLLLQTEKSVKYVWWGCTSTAPGQTTSPSAPTVLWQLDRYIFGDWNISPTRRG